MLGDKIMAGYVCKIVIEDSHPPIWRRVIIPDKVTFFDVHRIIQILFGWEDMHLHEFTLPSENIVMMKMSMDGVNGMMKNQLP